MATFREALRTVVDVGYVILNGQDDAKKEEYEKRAYALNTQMHSDFGTLFPGHDEELSPAAEGLLDELVKLLAP